MKDFKDNTRERSDAEVIKRLFSYMVPFYKQLIVIFILMFIAVAVQLLPSLLLGLTIDNVASDA
ncbi:MAG: hypothetical protein WCR19_06765, partial [Acholeplasmataceae bacterium]